MAANRTVSSFRTSLSSIEKLLACITGPKLRRLYYHGVDIKGSPYVPNNTERYADNVLLAAYLLCSIVYHVSPVYAVYYICRYGFPSIVGVMGTFKWFSFVPISVTLAYIARGIGRYKNETYNTFLLSLRTVQRQGLTDPREVNQSGIEGYDFQMKSFPVTFRHSESSVKPRRLTSARRRGLIEKLTNLPLSSLRYIAACVVARRLVYPGSLFVFNILLESMLSEGRSKLRRQHNAQRAKLMSVDGNYIDCVFIDKRRSPDSSARGNKLVICCEGNAAYYEVGQPEIAITAGYSVIGWNHPGFGESTGLPFPDQEFNAIDVVIRYSVTKLGFELNNIYLLAWSIGGYTASCAAMSYPDIGGVMLDATFDELYPLAIKQVPPLFHGFTYGVINDYYNLNIAEQICHYKGPLIVMRREQDEMMSSNNDIATNRANFLLIKILQTRYPNLITPDSLKEIWKWLRAPVEWTREQILSDSGVVVSHCKAKIVNYKLEHGNSYPWLIGDKMKGQEKIQLLLYLASRYMLNYRSTHCVPLPASYLQNLGKNHFD